jgi:hypothetical protein
VDQSTADHTFEHVNTRVSAYRSTTSIAYEGRVCYTSFSGARRNDTVIAQFKALVAIDTAAHQPVNFNTGPTSNPMRMAEKGVLSQPAG